MTESTEREPLPGEVITGGELVDGRVVGGSYEFGPKAFDVKMARYVVLLCDPDMPIEWGSAVLLRLADGSTFEGTVLTKHPERARTIDVELHSGHTLRRCAKSDLTRIVKVVSRI